VIDTMAASPAERLTASRERLRQALRDTAAARSGHAGQGSGASWLNTLKAIPGVGIVVEALQAWWKQHPLHVTGTVVSEALQAAVRPLAQRHPLGLMVAALLVGGLLVSSRPWRWILTPTLLAGLLPQLLAKAVALVPAQSWLAALDALAQGRKDPVAPSRHDAGPAEPPRQQQTH
jgi:hypothetical protein